MGKNKHKKFAENETFSNLFQPSFQDIWGKDFRLKGSWRNEFFNNPNPIVLELGCGKGEYTVGLARLYPNKNFIGVDIKGARIWKGAKEATLTQLPNVAFIRTRIEHIPSFFAPDEVSEIWLTFPDPQPRASKARKRLSSSRFLSYYQKFLMNNGLIHLKTDSQDLHHYTKALAKQNNLTIADCTNDLYNGLFKGPVLDIQTHYERMFLEDGLPITYLCFELDHHKTLSEPDLEQ